MTRKTFLTIVAGALVAPVLPMAGSSDTARGCFAFEDEVHNSGRFNWNQWNHQFPGTYSQDGKLWQRWAPVRDVSTHEIRGFIYSTGHWKTDMSGTEARVVWIGENPVYKLRS